MLLSNIILTKEHNKYHNSLAILKNAFTCL